MSIKDNESKFEGKAKSKDAMSEITNLAQTHLILKKEEFIQREKTKRLLIISVFLLIISASLIFTLAPSERENIAYIIGSALIILALGVLGASRVVLKAPGLSVEADNGDVNNKSHLDHTDLLGENSKSNQEWDGVFSLKKK
jgi:hypothetical protein